MTPVTVAEIDALIAAMKAVDTRAPGAKARMEALDREAWALLHRARDEKRQSDDLKGSE